MRSHALTAAYLHIGKCSPLRHGAHTHGLAKPLQFLPVHLASILIPAAVPHCRLLCQQPCCSSAAAVWLAGTSRLLPSACHVLLLLFVRCFCFFGRCSCFLRSNLIPGCLLGCLRGSVWVLGSAPSAAAGATQCLSGADPFSSGLPTDARVYILFLRSQHLQLDD